MPNLQTITIVTLFPDIFQKHLEHLPLKKALEKGIVKINLVDLHNFAIDERGTVDSPAYGGGPGMILRPEPIYNAVKSIPQSEQAEVIFLTPKGAIYDQQKARNLSNSPHIILICGRYEGIDQRVIEELKAQELSIGQYVLSGGEVAAMAVMESVVRLLPGAIDNTQALTQESFNQNTLEHPQYSRPREWKNRSVPQILVSGDHKKVQTWKDTNSPRF